MTAVLLTVAAFVVGLVASPNPAAAAPSGWHVTASLALGTEDTDVACPAAKVCWAIEAGKFLRSTDGGLTWADRSALVPSGVAALNALACPAAATCYVTAQTTDGAPEVLVLQPGQLTPFAVPATAKLPTIACVSVDRCLATDGTTAFVTANDAQSWATYPLARPITTRPALSCAPDSTRCWVVGDSGATPVIEYSTHVGNGWTLQSAPSGLSGLYDVSCPSTISCYAVGADATNTARVIRTANAGATWGFASTPAHASALRSVSCSVSIVCTAVGQSSAGTPFAFVTTTGSTWTASTLPAIATRHPAQVACPTTSTCTVVAGAVAFTTANGAASWTTISLPAAIEAPRSLACASDTRCVGVGNDAAGGAQVITTVDGGTTWTPQTPHTWPSGVGTLNQVACPSGLVCFALAATRSTAQALYSTDGGATWRLGTVSSPAGVLRALSCSSTTTCVAAGYDKHSAPILRRTVDRGKTWTAVAVPPDTFAIDALACGTSDCLLITSASNSPTTGPEVSWVTTDFATYTGPYQLPAGNYVDASCGATTCAAVGSDGGSGAIAVTHDFGATWLPASVPTAAQLLNAVSCNARSDWCAAAAYDSRSGGGPVLAGSVDHGMSWTAVALPAGNAAPLDVGCGRTLCFVSAVSATGNPIILSGQP